MTRQIYCGAGLLGGEKGEHPFQISQRADFFEVEVGLETTLKRPIVNTRDEPHADPEKYRRLHVIIGDANMSEVATYLKVGVTSIVLMMIEDEAVTEEFAFENPVAALRAFSHDLTLRKTARLKDGRAMRAIDVQWGYHEMASKYFGAHRGADVVHGRDVPLGGDPRPRSSAIRGRWLRSWIGSRSCRRSSRTTTSTGSSGTTRSCIWSTCSTTTCARTRDRNVLYRKGKLERISTEEEVLRAIERPAVRHARLLPRPLPREVRAAGRGGVVGFA